jgi:hypothetical protein
MNLKQLTTLYRLAYRLNHLEYIDTLTRKIDNKLSKYPKFVRKLLDLNPPLIVTIVSFGKRL